jgi:hypothetical protein
MLRLLDLLDLMGGGRRFPGAWGGPGGDGPHDGPACRHSAERGGSGHLMGFSANPCRADRPVPELWRPPLPGAARLDPAFPHERHQARIPGASVVVPP